jgi:hypothetical protein
MTYILAGLEAKRRITMSHFFTYEERLDLQEHLKVYPLKKSAEGWIKAQKPFQERSASMFLRLPPVIRGFPTMHARTILTAERKVSATKNAQEPQQSIANLSKNVMTNAPSSSKRSVQQDSACLMFVMTSC